MKLFKNNEGKKPKSCRCLARSERGSAFTAQQ